MSRLCGSAGFLNVGTTGVLGWIVLCAGGQCCALKHSTPISIQDTPPSSDNQKSLQILPNVPCGGTQQPPLGTSVGKSQPYSWVSPFQISSILSPFDVEPRTTVRAPDFQLGALHVPGSRYIRSAESGPYPGPWPHPSNPFLQALSLRALSSCCPQQTPLPDAAVLFG